jgi:hypothetical protein
VLLISAAEIHLGSTTGMLLLLGQALRPRVLLSRTNSMQDATRQVVGVAGTVPVGSV